MCEKVDQLVKQTRLTDLFAYTERGLMTVKNAAVAAELTPKEFITQMQMNGYTSTSEDKEVPFVIGGIRLTEDSLQSSMQTCFGGAEGFVCYPRVPPSSLLYIKIFPIWR